MATIMVTGASGRLGSLVTDLLRSKSHHVHAHRHFRTSDDDALGILNFYGDLAKGGGVAEAVKGVDAIIHCASFFDQDGSTDRESTAELLKGAKASGSPHFVYISIVGVEKIDHPYFQTKLAVEGMVADSGLPFSIQRATQFHDTVLHLIEGFTDNGQILLPPGLRFQSIAAEEVGAVLVETSQAEPKGRASDIAGPEVLSLQDMAMTYIAKLAPQMRVGEAEGDSNPLLHDAFRDGRNLAPDRIAGAETWARFLDEQRDKPPSSRAGGVF